MLAQLYLKSFIYGLRNLLFPTETDRWFVQKIFDREGWDFPYTNECR